MQTLNFYIVDCVRGNRMEEWRNCIVCDCFVPRNDKLKILFP
jgi:hypothetical protein